MPHRYLFPVLILPILALLGCGSDRGETTTSRYSTQTFTLAGGMAVMTQITDHEQNILYYYKLVAKKGLVLQSTIDLTKTGDQTIPGEGLNPNEANPGK